MAGQLPDARALSSWEDAFQHPLPVVRKLEQQLGKNIDDNRQKLRSLVGASYRDLLGTAERIIEMDNQIETVETYLGDIGKKCNARTVEKIGQNHAHMRRTIHARDGEHSKAMAQTKVLQAALTTMGRIVKADGDALQASKLLVLSRLVYKSISESPKAPAVLEELRRKLATLRKKLLSYIERQMVLSSLDKAQLANTLCAYALVTSSTPKEVLRYFLQVRYEQLENKSESASDTTVLQMLDLYSQTLLDTRDLFPRRFAEALSQLAKIPLLKDVQVLSVFELNLDVYGGWITEDVRTFTPWVRHDQLTSSEVTNALESWTQQAQDCILHGLKGYLSGQTTVHAIVEVRQQVLSKYLALSSKLRNNAQGNAINDLREAFLSRLEELAANVANVNDLYHDEVSISTLVKGDFEQESMWELAADDFDLANGALKFRRSIIQGRYNRSKSIQSEIEKLDKWMSRVNGIMDLVDEMRMGKWDNDLDFDSEDLDESDSIVESLSKEDPDRLQQRLRKAIEETLDQVITNMSAASTTTARPAFQLRVWREVEQRSHQIGRRVNIAKNEVSLVALHRNLAESVSKDAVDRYVRSAKMQTRAAVILWDGSPSLPIQPSPTVFRFLKMLHRAMSDVGSDLWSPNAVFEMQSVILASLATQLDDKTFANLMQSSTLTNGHLEAGDGNSEEKGDMPNGTEVAEDSRRNWLLQNLFDLHYLRRIFYRGDHVSEEASTGSICSTIQQQLELDDVLDGRLKKSANEYWKRTYLLFGLLAPGSSGNSD